ncbi:thioredoxin [Striga asiatica]|uniref:Thioredoxin n=1 Tax=Striga asiatica TaxID=4170 RepID=A0A5A7RDU6_STRAF|nr:thioredoxin [Striga asiatica]
MQVALSSSDCCICCPIWVLSFFEKWNLGQYPTFHLHLQAMLNLPSFTSHALQEKNYGDDSDHTFEIAGGNVHLITTKESWDQKLAEAQKDGKIVVANFSAAWCGPCRMIAPFFAELSEKHPSLMFLTVDVDELTDFSTSLDIKATPTFFFLKNGQQLEKLVGANKPELQKKMDAILDSENPCPT